MSAPAQNGSIQKPSQAIASLFSARTASRYSVEDDATTRFVQRFNDDSQWKILRGVPVFDEHEESRYEPELDANGKPMIEPSTGKPRLRKVVERFGVAELERHAANSNNLVAIGKAPGLVVGHTKDEGPEHQQPETIGHAKNYRVAFVPSLNRHAVLQDEYYYPNRYEEAKTFPYRSVERWKRGEYFAPVALLRREPARSLGVVSYSKVSAFDHKADDCIRYSMGERVIYNMDPAHAPMGGAPPAGGPANPANPQAPGAPPADPDAEKFAKLLQQYMSNPENCAKMAAAMQGGGKPPSPAPAVPPPPPPAPGEPPAAAPAPPAQMAASAPAPSPSMPGGMNTSIPQPAQEKPEMSQAYQLTADFVARYEAERKELLERIDVLQAESEESRRGERCQRYGAVLNRMKEVDGYAIDVAEQLYECQDMTQDDFDKRVKLIERLGASNRVPLGDGPLRHGANHRPVRNDQPLTKEQMDYALKYQAEQDWKVSTQEAQAKAREAIPG